ncbi:MAG: tetratricopeptide repeat protein [Terriglobia bacterium]
MRSVPLVLLFLAAALSGIAAAPQADFDRVRRQAEAARSAEQIAEAIRLYRESVRLRPSWSEGWWWLGSLYYEQDRFPEAQSALRRFVTMDPKPGPAYAFLALCEYETRDYSRALEHFQQWARQGSPGTDALIDVAGFHWALLLTREGRFVQALYLLSAKAQRRGHSPALAEAMGLASLRMATLPEDYPPEKRESVWLAGEAAFYASLRPQAFDRSDDYARRLLFHYGQEPNVHFFRGTLLVFQKKRDAAKEEFEQELRKSPQHAPALVELARLSMEDRQFGEAESFARHALQTDSKDPMAHLLLGRTLLAQERLPESARELETASQLAPDSAAVRFQLATAYRKLGRNQEAQREFAVFASLKNKPEVLISPEEFEEMLRTQPEKPQ